MSLNQTLRDLHAAFPDSEQKMPTLFVGHGSPMNAIEENDFSHAVWLELETGLQGAAGIESGADSIGERRGARERGRIVETAIATEEVSAVAGP